MAGNKISTKTKSKDDKNKANKVLGQSTEDGEEPDFALLRKPIHTSITGFGQARKIFDLATEELKDLLSNECDLLYECKVCRNIFRSLANFISHKRVYCKEKFSSSQHSHFVKSTSLVSEIMKIKNLEQSYQDFLKEEPGSENEEDDRIPLTKDLTTIIEKIAKNKGSCLNSSSESRVSLQKIPNSSVAMFQNMQFSEENDSMKAEVNELNKILSKGIAVLQGDGNFKVQSSIPSETDSVIQISDDDDNDSQSILKCKICDMQFSTKKTLKFHMKSKHVESRLVYSCPDCLEIFATSWSVFRHLFKVHRKTPAQIRRLRESIQSKAFKMNNPPAFYEKRKNTMKNAAIQKITEEERRDQENQAWMDNMEGDGELPRCGGCGRTFERRAALAAHTHTCQPRSRALRRPDAKRIEIQIRKDYHKGPPAPPSLNPPPNPTDANENKIPKEEPKESREVEIDREPIEDEKDSEKDTPMEVSEDDQKSNESTESPEKEPPTLPSAKRLVIRLPFAFQTEKANFAAFRQRIEPDVDLPSLLCKTCNSQFQDVDCLYDHVADHIKWVRYACKLCNFKHYAFEKLPEHVKVVHKLKGDKDFYFSTVKAVDAAEALGLCVPVEEREVEMSPESRRPSRCSSDSSRLSDDSSSSSARVDSGARKRKLCHMKHSVKKRKEAASKGEDSKDSDFSEKNTNSVETMSSNIKSFEENSSDMDDIDDRLPKKQIKIDESSVASRRPVRRKTKPKNEDFEYDLSNLLKMEAQGYRESISTSNTKSSQQSKKKALQDIQNNYENQNRDCCGALITMAKKSVEISAAHMKTNFNNVYPVKEIRQSVFLRPMLPKTLSKGEKVSPKKDAIEDRKEIASPNKEMPLKESPIKDSNEPPKAKDVEEIPIKIEDLTPTNAETLEKPELLDNEPIENESDKNENEKINPLKSQISTGTAAIPTKPKFNIPAVVPIKFRRQSLEVIKSPLINKNIKEFTKAGMKTKILVIKPINRDKDGKQSVNTPLKFQTIKLKDPNKTATSGKLSNDQVVVVKVPKVVPISDICNTNEQVGSNDTTSVTKTVEIANSNVNDNNDILLSNINGTSKSVETCENDSEIPADDIITNNHPLEEKIDKQDNEEDVANIMHEDFSIKEHESENFEIVSSDSINSTTCKDVH